MSNLCIIPARGGSKRIPKKNIKKFLGKPIIAYSIEVAISSQLFDEVMVSTDNAEIVEISKQYGASVPFLRTNENANDHAVLSDVVDEVLNKYKSLGQNFDNICCILPTAPFISVEKLKQAYKKLNEKKLDAVFPVLEFSFPIQRSLQIENEKVSMVWKQYLNTRSQDLPARYHDAGQFYWFKQDTFLKKKRIYTDNSGAIIISQLEAQDIDNDIDWKIAEIKYRILNEISR